MSETSVASAFSAEFLIHLVECGIEHIVVSPGSRSQALALVAAELEARGDVQLHVRIDERSAGFFALGIALETQIPAVVITTSGTAVANLFPAVLEAHHSGVPMIVVTADRPHELRGLGVNQTTHQDKIFGFAPRAALDEPVSTSPESGAERGRERAQELWKAATDIDSPGPVHLNVAFVEPLSSSVPLRDASDASYPSCVLEHTLHSITTDLNTIVIAGTGAGDEAEDCAHAGGWPLLAEVTSGSRYGRNLISAYRRVLGEQDLTSAIERIIIFGHPTLSREVPALLADLPDAEVIVIKGSSPEIYNPTSRQVTIADAVRVETSEPDLAWLGLWITRGREYAEEYAHAVVDNALLAAPDVSGSRSSSGKERKEFLAAELAASRSPISREVLVGTVWKASWPHDRLVFGASRLIRVADKYVPGKKIPVFANRGLAGIDGTISTARGIAAASDGAVTRVLLGDLATVHDIGSLTLTHGEELPHVQVIVGNDHGGTIFDALEVSQSATPDNIDRVLLTPVDVDLEKLAEGFGWSYVKVATVSQLEAALVAPHALPQLVEVELER